MLSAAKIKYIHSLKVKKYRKKYAEFVAEGRKVIRELAEAGLPLKALYIREDLIGNWPVDLFRRATLVTEADLKEITNLATPSEALAIFGIPDAPATLLPAGAWVLALDDIQDPGNMGTIIRTADWFGIRHILCSDGCVDAYNPKVVQASMASVGRVQITETDLARCFAAHPNIPVYGAVFDGKPYQEQDFSRKGVLLIGNEGHGINPELQQYIQFPVTIPRIGQAESLNAAIACALISARACL